MLCKIKICLYIILEIHDTHSVRFERDDLTIFIGGNLHSSLSSLLSISVKSKNLQFPSALFSHAMDASFTLHVLCRNKDIARENSISQSARSSL